uniref:Uncharacterized protein n=1 Tax=Eutreptiella gymnastica TaxID=73025 RepID=A0A7S4G4Z9_9EUGL|mmetsp:Transcript_5736/g.8836  ORF Transcript_5736/g.8836 Transcript_5736/m.8836 type:complete len:158 (+) Transcript_5736:390-863(+)
MARAQEYDRRGRPGGTGEPLLQDGGICFDLGIQAALDDAAPPSTAPEPYLDPDILAAHVTRTTHRPKEKCKKKKPRKAFVDAEDFEKARAEWQQERKAPHRAAGTRPVMRASRTMPPTARRLSPARTPMLGDDPHPMHLGHLRTRRSKAIPEWNVER